MITELQNKVWLVLPKEFKEEVKKLYSRFLFTREGYYDELFGKHNLTSDAEGEEMLTVPRKDIVELYQEVKKTISQCKGTEWAIQSIGIKNVLWSLFGSKCLPNEEQPKQKDCDNPLADQEGCRWRNNGKCAFDSACYFEPLNPQEPKPAEAKYKVGDKVRLKDVYEIEEINEEQTMVGLKGCAYMEDIDNLEPYTEPAEPTCTRTCTDDCPSQHKIPCVNLSQETANCDKCNGLRLHIAAMAMQGLLASPVDANMQSKSVDYIVKASFEYADALIAEAEKGGAVGNS